MYSNLFAAAYFYYYFNNSKGVVGFAAADK